MKKSNKQGLITHLPTLQGGFTIIELMVVLLIMFVLLALVAGPLKALFTYFIR